MPSILETGLDLVKQRMLDIPTDKNGALITTVEWKYGLPLVKIAVATRVNGHFQIGAEAESSFKKTSTNASVYASLVW